MIARRLPTVLIVDDDDDTRIAAEQYLNGTARWRVRSMNDVGEALALVATRAFEAILLNLSLGGATPQSVLRVLQVARATRPLMNIVVVGDHDEASEAIDGVHRLATAYLPRPQPMHDIERALRGTR